MMKKIVIITMLFISSFLANAQVYQSFNNVHLEKIYVHKNATLLFVGEYLYYKVYCIEAETNKPSETSKIAYVELISKNKNVVFKQKITLQKGMGYGEFFIPTTVLSGNYKLIAYTQWMQNNSDFQFFKTELNIINPYMGNQGEVTTASKNSSSEKTKIQNQETHKTNNNRRYKLQTDKDVYANREKVTVQFINIKKAFGFGNYSISVRKIDSINKVSNYTARTYYSDNFNKKIINKSFKKIIIPEINGELVSGKVVYKGSGNKVEKTKVTLTIPDDELLLKIVDTDKNGAFHIYLNREFDGDIAYLQVVGEDRNEYKIRLENPIAIDYGKLDFNSFYISAENREFIVDRSIHNQIENTYFSVKPDSLLSKPRKEKFYTTEDAVIYQLKDYKSFPTLNEVFIEIIDPVYKKIIDGKINFHIKHRNDYVNDGAIPLVLLDGVLIQDYQSLLQYDASKVEKVTILKDKMSIGAIPFAGVIAIETKSKDYSWSFKEDKLTKVLLQKTIPHKKYYRQNYNDSLKNRYSRIPDFRNQLFWSSQFIIDSNIKEFTFYTSDLQGKFEIIVEGFSAIGEAISLRKIIEVTSTIE